MNLLQKAATETRAALGINVPTALVFIIGIGLTIVLVNTLPAPETNSVAGFLLWFIKSVARFAAVLVVFLPLFAWHIFQVARQQRSARAHLRIATQTVALADDQIKSFLRNHLNDQKYGVAKCYVFGSIVRQYQSRDVDVIIQFDSSKPGRVRTYHHRLRNIESIFQEFHNLKLHLQMFLSTEDKALDRFLNKTGMYERII